MVAQDANGVICLYSNNGQFFPFDGASNGGTRWDCMNPPVNAEYTGYFQGGSSDDMAAKLAGGRHSSSNSCQGCCYIPACDSGGGSPGYRTECPHDAGPTYATCDATRENDCPSFSSFKGLKAIKWNTAANCVHWEFWADTGTSSSTPANQWVRLMHKTDCTGDCRMSECGGGPLLRPRSDTNVFTWRCDGGPSTKWTTCVELVPGNGAPPPAGGGGTTPPGTTPGTGGSGPGTPGTGGTGGGSTPGGNGVPTTGGGEPTPNGNGGGGAGNDNSTGTAQAFASGGCAIAIAGNTRAQAGNCGGTAAPPTNPGDGGVGGATEPKPIVTVYKDLSLLYNIRTDLFDNCTISGDLNIGEYESVYAVNPIQDQYLTVFQNSTTAFVGVKLHASSSALHKKVIRKVSVTMKRSTAVALTGNLIMQIRDRNGNIMTEFDTIIDPAAVALNDTTYDFIHNANSYQMQAGDMVLFSYADGGDTTNHILVASAPGVDNFDGFNTVYVESPSGLFYDVDQLQDAAFSMYT